MTLLNPELHSELVKSTTEERPWRTFYFSVCCSDVDERGELMMHRTFEVRVDPEELKYLCAKSLRNKSGKAQNGPLTVRPM